MAERTRLNTSTVVVVGDDLAAGAGDFGLREDRQVTSFAALFAHQLGAEFRQPIIQAPGIGPALGMPAAPVVLPQAMQTTVLAEFPPTSLISNVSVPGLRLEEAVSRRPVSPLIHRSDARQTALNLIVGLPGLLLPGSQPAPTAIEYAAFRQPTLTVLACDVSVLSVWTLFSVLAV